MGKNKDPLISFKIGAFLAGARRVGPSFPEFNRAEVLAVSGKTHPPPRGQGIFVPSKGRQEILALKKAFRGKIF
jgi:hypothetical protein